MMDILERCKDAKAIGIAGHIRPDGDCVGSVMGLYLFLKKKLPTAQVHAFIEKPADIFNCIKDVEQIKSDFTTSVPQYDVFFALDCAKDRLGQAEMLFDQAENTINIDHHISNTGCGKENYIVPGASSTSELIYNVIADKKDLDEGIAKALYIGIIHDTGVFQYSNTSPETLQIAAELISYGFDFPRLIDETFYEKTYIQNQILGRTLLESILFMEGRCIVSMVDQKTMNFYGVNAKDLDGIINQMRFTKGVECAIFMYQIGTQEYKVSLRSCSVIDVAAIAAFFGGGGHVRAAGATIHGSYHDVINNVSALIEGQYKQIEKEQ